MKGSFVAATILLGMINLPGIAQETRGSIGGTVHDSSGAVIPNAAVTAINQGTNVTMKTSTNQNGDYDLLFLLPGTYTVTVSSKGFKTSRSENLELRIHDRLRLDIDLQVGAVSDEVRVTADAPLLNTETANLGQVIDSRRITELPVPHGSPYSLLFLSPGVSDNGQTRQYQETSNLDGIGSQLSFNGAPTGTSDWTIDGTPNTQSSHGIGPMNSPPADIVQELKVETAFDASVGHTSGLLINLAIKSGVNKPHGAAYGFFRNPDWDANTFLANRAGQGKGNYEYKRWGASLTGPVYIPKIYNGHDRTFFSYGYEGVHRTEVNPFIGTVPDPKFLNGDFSSLLALGTQYQIYDPATAKFAADGRVTRDPFPNNIIPSNRISPIAKNILTHFPKPNQTGGPDTTNNFGALTAADPDTYYNHTARVDHSLSDKQKLFARFTAMHRNAGPYRNYWEDVAMANNFSGTTRQGTIDDVYTLSPSFVMNVRYGYSRFSSGHFPRRLGFDVSALGFPASTVSLLQSITRIFPRVDINGIARLAFEGPDVLNNDIHSFFTSFNKQLSTHNLKFGADLRSNRENVYFLQEPGGYFQFNPDFTVGPFDNSAAGPFGQGLASLLLGQPTGGRLDRNDNQSIQSTYWAFYIHDNWRATRKLTLDLGLRWEYEGPVTERFDRSVRGFDPNAQLPIAAAARAAYAAKPDPAIPPSQFRVQGGLLFAGRNGVSRELWDKSLRNFAPRFGFAYQAFKNIVLRGGIGVFPISIGQPVQNRAITSGFDQDTQIVPSLDAGLTFAANLNNPFPSGILRAAGASLGPATFLGRGLTFYNPIPRTPYTTQWSFNTQSVLPGQLLLEVGYVGSKTVKLIASHDIDALPNQYLSTSPLRDQNTINFLTANIPNPFAGLLPGTSLNGSTIPRQQLLRPYPQFASISMRDRQGYSWYNALQVRLERRFSRGITTLVGYSFSKKMDATEYLNAGDPLPYRTISAIDRPHQLSFSAIYELPFGKGRHFLAQIPRIGDAIIGGWQLGSVYQFNSGFPIGFGNALFLGNVKDIALPRGERTLDRWFNTNAGFVRSTAQQLQFNQRTFPIRFSGIRTGAYNSWDISLLKNVRILENHQFQFRAEFYNAFNHPSAWDGPVTNPTSSAFGQITGMLSLPRQIQFGAKYVF